jgi:AcrR family transcriptional regulator
MNKTKRKIFEASMKLFAEKGYEGTSIEEITSEVGVAKGTLYYHFTSKEEIFDFLISEGMGLLENSIQIKVNKQDNYVDKVRAIILIQVKLVEKYEKFITILTTEMWGNSERSKACRNFVSEYLKDIKKILDEGIEKGELKETNTDLMSKEILGFLFSSLYAKKMNPNFTVEETFKSIDRDFMIGIKAKSKM